MIFAGSNSVKLKGGAIKNITCPNCDQYTTINYAIRGKYAHLYWIPCFPMGRIAFFECQYCKRLFKLPELPQTIKTKYEFQKQGVKTPMWFYSGLFVLGFLIVMLIGFAANKENATAQQIANPEINDRYGIKGDENGHYSVMKVIKVTPDSLYVIYNDFNVNETFKAKSLNPNQNFTTTPVGFTRAEIQDRYNRGAIYGVYRD